MSNIVRGNVIGTSLKPELNLLKATGLTPEEQAEVRKNIGADIPYFDLYEMCGLEVSMNGEFVETSCDTDAIFNAVNAGAKNICVNLEVPEVGPVEYTMQVVRSGSDIRLAGLVSYIDFDTGAIPCSATILVRDGVLMASVTKCLTDATAPTGPNTSGEYVIHVDCFWGEDEPYYKVVNYDWDKLVNAISSGKRVYCRLYDHSSISYTNDEYTFYSFDENYECFTFIKMTPQGLEFIEIDSVGYAILSFSSFPIVDATLSRRGQAADAKTVGDAIAEVYTTIGDIETALDSIIALQESLIVNTIDVEVPENE